MLVFVGFAVVVVADVDAAPDAAVVVVADAVVVGAVFWFVSVSLGAALPDVVAVTVAPGYAEFGFVMSCVHCS